MTCAVISHNIPISKLIIQLVRIEFYNLTIFEILDFININILKEIFLNNS